MKKLVLFLLCMAWASLVQAGGSRSFDGIDDRVEVAQSTSWNVNTISASFWINSTEVWDTGWWPGDAMICGIPTSGPGSKDWAIGGEIEGGINGRLITTSGPSTGGDTNINSLNAVTDGVWHFVIFTRNGSGGANVLYVDGNQDGTATDSGGNINGARKLNLGGEDIHSGGQYLDGLLAYYQHFTRVITSYEREEIRWNPGSVVENASIFLTMWGSSPEPDLSGTGNSGSIAGASESGGGPPVFQGQGLPL